MPYTYTYDEAEIIKLRKIRDSLGVMTTNPNLSHDEKELLFCTLSELAMLPGVGLASEATYRGIKELDEVCAPHYGWRMYV